MAKKKPPTPQEQIEQYAAEIIREQERWQHLKNHGGSDPFWEDGEAKGMKRVWARIGMSLIISDEEAEQLLNEAGRNDAGGNCEYDITDSFAERFVKNGKVDGESYIPDSCIYDVEKSDNLEKLGYIAKCKSCGYEVNNYGDWDFGRNEKAPICPECREFIELPEGY